MNRIEILSQWSVNTEGENTPNFRVDYAGKFSTWEDITRTPSPNLTPNPNQVVLRVECNDATLALIEADTNYFVLTSEVIDEEP